MSDIGGRTPRQTVAVAFAAPFWQEMAVTPELSRHELTDHRRRLFGQPVFVRECARRACTTPIILALAAYDALRPGLIRADGQTGQRDAA